MVRPIATEQNRDPGWELIDMLETLSAAGLSVIQINNLIPSRYDYIGITYTGDNATTIVYKTGGALGATVGTLTLAYTGTKLDSVTKT